MIRPFTSALFAAVAFFCPVVAGCIPFVPCYYAYPTLSFVPGTNIGPDRDNIYAFRVDVADNQSCTEFPKLNRYVFCEVHITPEGAVPGQTKAAIDNGFIWNCIALIFSQHTSHTVRVRLYRPGYELVEIKSWDFGHPIKWREATNLDGQESALDALLGTTGNGWGLHYSDSDKSQFYHLEPGSVSGEHRHALLFAAAEYERLGRSLDLEPGKREKLEAKARALRELADR